MSKRRSKQERDKLRDEWQQRQKERERFEAHIAEIEELIELGVVTDAQLEDHRLFPEFFFPKLSPAMQFLSDRLSGVSSDDDYDNKWKQAIVDLVKSDIPLDPRSRSLLAGDLHRLYFPNDERDRRDKQRMEAAWIEELMETALSRGMTTAEAREEIAKALGINSVEALRKRVQRAPK
jgi:hypothetical protein